MGTKPPAVGWTTAPILAAAGAAAGAHGTALMTLTSPACTPRRCHRQPHMCSSNAAATKVHTPYLASWVMPGHLQAQLKLNAAA